MSKYEPLARYLRTLKNDRWTANFAEIEKILGFPLPTSARKYNAWWANQTGGGHSQSSSWQSAGWNTAEPNFQAKTIKFIRNRPVEVQPKMPEQLASAPRTPPTQPAEIEGNPATFRAPMLTIEEAKFGLSAFYGVPIDKIEITIRG